VGTAQTFFVVCYAFEGNIAYGGSPHRLQEADSVAQQIFLKHPGGLCKIGYVGFSWTSLFFGGFPASLRGDWLAFMVYQVLCIIGSLMPWSIGAFVLWITWPFFYNRWHVSRLTEKGYQVTNASAAFDEAKARLTSWKAL
jgi:hypothetical protein